MFRIFVGLLKGFRVITLRFDKESSDDGVDANAMGGDWDNLRLAHFETLRLMSAASL